jgi:tRNA pseudouridine55 synthase
MPAPIHGLLVVDKPGGLTSRDVVNRIQGCFPRGTRIGHTGTLDPLATGVLVLCLGQATRLTEYIQDMGKTYRAVFRLGARSDTDDAAGTVEVVVGPVPNREAVTKAVSTFIGNTDQVPPAYSAAKVSGARAYNLARKGREVSLQPRRVRIDAIDVLAYDYPRLEVEVRCGKGTYIRSLARDLGQRLGCGALVEELRRTRVGPFAAADGITLDLEASAIVFRVLPLAAAVADLPQLTLPPPTLDRLRHGQKIPFSVLAVPPKELTAPGKAAVVVEDGSLVAIARLNFDDQTLSPEKVFRL